MKNKLNLQLNWSQAMTFVFSLILYLGCHIKSKNSKAEPALSESTMKRLAAQMPLEICQDCRLMDDVHRFEDSLGSRKIVLSDGEISRVFEGYYYSWDPIADSTYYKVDTSYFKVENEYFEFFIRPCTNDSLPNAAVAYLYNFPHRPEIRGEQVLETSGSWIKFFYSDDVLSRYLPQTQRSNLIFEPDSAFVSTIFTGLESKIDQFVPKSSNKLLFLNHHFYNVDEYKYEKGTYYGDWIDTLDYPNEPNFKSAMSFGEPGELEALPFRELYRNIDWEYDSFGILLSLGLSEYKEYYLRRKVRNGINYYRFDLKPKDLGMMVYFSKRLR